MIVLDRYEQDIAVLEMDGIIKRVPRTQLVGEIAEGSVLIRNNDGYILDEQTTKTRREKLVGLQDSLFE